MKFRRASLTFAACFALFVLFMPNLFGCGPFFAESVFTFTSDPDYPRSQFVAGKLGIVKGTWRPSELVVAYRYLSGLSLSPQEQAPILKLWAQRDHRDLASDQSGGDQTVNPAVAAWQKARLTVPGTTDVSIQPNASDNYAEYVNCTDDAFRNAAATLAVRARQWGANSPDLKEWLKGQDAVFQNCAIPGAAPPAAVVTKNALLRSDRNYQIAAAHFYARQFDDAISSFDEIAKDTNSPWHAIAPYLAARAIVRKATLYKMPEAQGDQQPSSFDRAAMEQAAPRLRAIIANQRLASIHGMAQRELDFVNFRVAKDDAIADRARELTSKEVGPQIDSAIWDYSNLLTDGANKDHPDDMTDWIRTMQGGNTLDMNEEAASDPKARADAYHHAYERWQKSRSVAWLVAALIQAPEGTQVPADLLKAASQLTPASPAYLSASYGALRLRENNDLAGVRRDLDTFLAKNADLPISALNAFLHLRFVAAANLDEFIRFGQRREAGETYGDIDMDATPEKPNTAFMLDRDAASQLNTGMPLAMLRDAINRHGFGPDLQRNIVLATWVRAALLDNADIAKSLAPEVNKVAPEMAINTKMYGDAPDAAARKFVLALTLGHFPGLRPYVPVGLGRSEKLDTIDSFRDNWWCPIGRPGYEASYSYMYADAETQKKRIPQQFPTFSSAGDRASATQEWTALTDVPTGPNFMLKTAIAWAQAHPNDPNTPEALHFAVRASRYGCVDDATGALSKQAHGILHKQYPNSPWTKKTPYWFGDKQ